MLNENQLQLLMSVYALDFVNSVTENWPEEYLTRLEVLRNKVSAIDKEMPDSLQLKDFIELVFDHCGV